MDIICGYKNLAIETNNKNLTKNNLQKIQNGFYLFSFDMLYIESYIKIIRGLNVSFNAKIGS